MTTGRLALYGLVATWWGSLGGAFTNNMLDARYGALTVNTVLLAVLTVVALLMVRHDLKRGALVEYREEAGDGRR